MQIPVLRRGANLRSRIPFLRRENVAELLEWIARQLVDEPDAVRVETEKRDDAIVFHLHVAPDDVGKVIGRQGRMARALRSIVRAGGARAEERYLLEIAD